MFSPNKPLGDRVKRLPALSSIGSIQGFTLLELLTVVAITAILAALIFPVANSMLGKGKSAKGMANMKTIGVAVSSFIADNDGRFPRGGWGSSGGSTWTPPDPPVGRSMGWLVDIWPYVGQKRDVFVCPAAPTDSPTGESSWAFMPNASASDPRYPMHYGYNAQLNSNRDDMRSRNQNVDRIVGVSRPAKLPVLIEVVFQNNFYGGVAKAFDPKASQTDGTAFATRHNGRGHVLWGDGSVSAHTAEEWSKMPEELVPTGNSVQKRWSFCKGDY